MLRFCVALLMLWSAIAWSDDSAALSPEQRTRRARALFTQGRAHVNLGDYPSAVKDFEEAYVLKPLPLFLYNLAELATFQGQRERALQLYLRYLQEEKTTGERAEAQRRVTQLRKSLAESPEVAAAPPGPAANPAAPAPPPAAAASPPSAGVAPSSPSPPAPAAPDTRPLVAPPPPARDDAAAAARARRRWTWGAIAGGAALLVGGAIALAVVFGRSTVDPTPTLGHGHLQ